MIDKPIICLAPLATFKLDGHGRKVKATTPCQSTDFDEVWSDNGDLIGFLCKQCFAPTASSVGSAQCKKCGCRVGHNPSCKVKLDDEHVHLMRGIAETKCGKNLPAHLYLTHDPMRATCLACLGKCPDCGRPIDDYIHEGAGCQSMKTVDTPTTDGLPAQSADATVPDGICVDKGQSMQDTWNQACPPQSNQPDPEPAPASDVTSTNKVSVGSTGKKLVGRKGR
jgi:hypothetical protein